MSAIEEIGENPEDEGSKDVRGRAAVGEVKEAVRKQQLAYGKLVGCKQAAYIGRRKKSGSSGRWNILREGIGCSDTLVNIFKYGFSSGIQLMQLEFQDVLVQFLAVHQACIGHLPLLFPPTDTDLQKMRAGVVEGSVKSTYSGSNPSSSC